MSSAWTGDPPLELITRPRALDLCGLIFLEAAGNKKSRASVNIAFKANDGDYWLEEELGDLAKHL